MASNDWTRPSPARRKVPRWLLGVGLLGVLVLVVSGAALQGYLVGQTQRTHDAQATLAADLKTQYDLGVADLAAGHYDLAAQRFEYIVALDPAYPGAAGKLAEARQALNITPTAPPPPTPTLPPVSGDPQTLLALAQQAHAAQHWDEVIAYLSDLHTLDPSYEATEVDRLLFEALRNRGVARIQGDEMELGLTDLDQAEAFAALDDEAKGYRQWATSYLAAQGYWGVNWEQVVLILEELYLIAPYFKDTATLLYDARLSYAQQLNAAGDACGAAAQYAAAQIVVTDPAVVEAQATAQAVCALAPTVTPTVSPELALTPTP
jgi:tetratricopeptide (TPR) repeat protein